jgi:hypothetical protein
LAVHHLLAAVCDHALAVDRLASIAEMNRRARQWADARPVKGGGRVDLPADSRAAASAVTTDGGPSDPNRGALVPNRGPNDLPSAAVSDDPSRQNTLAARGSNAPECEE